MILNRSIQNSVSGTWVADLDDVVLEVLQQDLAIQRCDDLLGERHQRIDVMNRVEFQRNLVVVLRKCQIRLRPPVRKQFEQPLGTILLNTLNRSTLPTVIA